MNALTDCATDAACCRATYLCQHNNLPYGMQKYATKASDLVTSIFFSIYTSLLENEIDNIHYNSIKCHISASTCKIDYVSIQNYYVCMEKILKSSVCFCYLDIFTFKKDLICNYEFRSPKEIFFSFGLN